MTMDLSVVIPAHTDLRLAQCLASIDVPVEVVIVLNRASEAVTRIAHNHPGAKVAVLDEANLGKAYNAGIKHSSCTKVLLMDSDCVFAPGTIGALYLGLSEAPLAKGRVVFRSSGPLSRTVARARE